MLNIAPGTKIYLACPYSDKNPNVRQARFEAINKVAAVLMNQGYIVFSPISHNHPIVLAVDLPLGWEYWEKFDESFLFWCDVMVIATLEGWKESNGVIGEHGIIRQLKKPCIKIDPYIEPYNVGKS